MLVALMVESLAEKTADERAGVSVVRLVETKVDESAGLMDGALAVQWVVAMAAGRVVWWAVAMDGEKVVLKASVSADSWVDGRVDAKASVLAELLVVQTAALGCTKVGQMDDERVEKTADDSAWKKVDVSAPYLVASSVGVSASLTAERWADETGQMMVESLGLLVDCSAGNLEPSLAVWWVDKWDEKMVELTVAWRGRW